MNKNTAKFLVNSQEHIDIPGKVWRRLAKKEILIVQRHYAAKQNRIKNWYKHTKSFKISFFSKVDNQKIETINLITIYSDGSGGINSHQQTYGRRIWNTTTTKKGKVVEHFTLSNLSSFQRPKSYIELHYPKTKGNYHGYYGYSIKSFDFFADHSHSRYLAKTTTILTEEQNKYKLSVWKALVSNGIVEWNDMKVTPLMELAVKEKWISLLMRYGDPNAKKPLLAFKKWFSSGEKVKFKLWLNMLIKRNAKYYDHQTWIDYVNMCKSRNITDFYNSNYSKIHNDWNLERANLKEKEVNTKTKIVKEELNKKKPILVIKRAKNQQELISLGQEMAICVGKGYSPKDIWIAKINNKIKICIEYRDNWFYQIKAFNNMDVPKRIQKIIKSKIRFRVSKQRLNTI